MTVVLQISGTQFRTEQAQVVEAPVGVALQLLGLGRRDVRPRQAHQLQPARD